MRKYKLYTVIWEITLKCNLRCLHCGSSAGYARSDELTTKEALKVVKELAELKAKDICLMGGEPFLRDDWFEIAKAIKDYGMELSFVSNGLILDKVIDDLAKLEPIVVGISLDGTEKVHDMIRGVKGSFKKVIEAINLLASRDIQTTVITTVSKLNLTELPKIKEILKNKNVNWQIQYALPIGRFDRKYLISPEEFYAIGIFIAHCNLMNPLAHFPVVGAHGMGYYSERLPDYGGWYGCTAGISSLGIRSNGNITGCLTLPEEYDEGNVRERSIADIWNDENTFPYTRKFNLDQLGENCRNCKFGSVCKGGCSASSLYLTGSFHNNPYCFRRLESVYKI